MGRKGPLFGSSGKWVGVESGNEHGIHQGKGPWRVLGLTGGRPSSFHLPLLTCRMNLLFSVSARFHDLHGDRCLFTDEPGFGMELPIFALELFPGSITVLLLQGFCNNKTEMNAQSCPHRDASPG